jgi:hypothetical protein
MHKLTLYLFDPARNIGADQTHVDYHDEGSDEHEPEPPAA